jgi:hypothetical protein
MLTRQVLCQFPWGRLKAACTPPSGVWADLGSNVTQNTDIRNTGTHNSGIYRIGIGRATHYLLLKLATFGGKLVFFVATVRTTIIQGNGIQGNGIQWIGNDWAGGTRA